MTKNLINRVLSNMHLKQEADLAIELLASYALSH